MTKLEVLSEEKIVTISGTEDDWIIIADLLNRFVRNHADVNKAENERIEKMVELVKYITAG